MSETLVPHGAMLRDLDPSRYGVKLRVNGVVYSRPSKRNGLRVPMKRARGPLPKKISTFLQELREDPEFQQVLRDVAMNPKSRNFPTVMKLLLAYDEEKPVVRKETQGRHEIVVRFEREGRRITAG